MPGHQGEGKGDGKSIDSNEDNFEGRSEAQFTTGKTQGRVTSGETRSVGKLGDTDLAGEPRRPGMKSPDDPKRVESLPPPDAIEPEDTGKPTATNKAQSRGRRSKEVDIEQKREASRLSSRRSQEKQKRRIETLTEEETRLSEANIQMREENEALRTAIQQIKSSSKKIKSQSDSQLKQPPQEGFPASTSSDHSRAPGDLMAMLSSGASTENPGGIIRLQQTPLSHTTRTSSQGMEMLTRNPVTAGVANSGTAAAPAMLPPLGSGSSSHQSAILGFAPHTIRQDLLLVEEAIRRSRASLAASVPAVQAARVQDLGGRHTNSAPGISSSSANSSLLSSPLRTRLGLPTNNIDFAGRRRHDLISLPDEPSQQPTSLHLQQSQAYLIDTLLESRQLQASQLLANLPSLEDLRTRLWGLDQLAAFPNQVASFPPREDSFEVQSNQSKASLARPPLLGHAMPSQITQTITNSASTSSSPYSAVYQQAFHRNRVTGEIRADVHMDAEAPEPNIASVPFVSTRKTRAASNTITAKGPEKDHKGSS